MWETEAQRARAEDVFDSVEERLALSWRHTWRDVTVVQRNPAIAIKRSAVLCNPQPVHCST